ncbi:MAG: NADH-quinone oxidoreductase subunit C [Candidatus Kariarchaeaceae archaeon]|jgi:NADH-quinone oxidoreductase subunit C
MKEIESKINTEFADAETKADPESRLNVSIDKARLVDVANFLKHELGFTLPNMCTGIDNKDHIEVLWHIGNTEDEILIILRTKTDRDESEVPSLTTVWKGLNWHERETYDLVGVKFVNHPDLRRLLLPENWEGHPLREDYVYRKPNYRKTEDL